VQLGYVKGLRRYHNVSLVRSFDDTIGRMSIWEIDLPTAHLDMSPVATDLFHAAGDQG
jgi:hypothetical protein